MTGAFEGVRTATVNGAILAYKEAGQGTPVVFVHGAISDLRTWHKQLNPIGASNRAIAYSRRYAPPNEAIGRDADDPILVHVDDLAAFIRAIDAVPASLVGNSWGSFISLLTAIRYPEIVRSLVLEEAAIAQLLGVSLPPRPSELISLLVRRPGTLLALAKGGTAQKLGRVPAAFERGDDRTAVWTFARAVVGEKPFLRFSEERKQQMLDNAGTLRALMLGTGPPKLSDEDFRGVRVPTLLITGELSPRGVVLPTRRLEDLLPNAERVSIADASHLMHEENAGATNEAILGFLARIDAEP
jgi:pimeloyl-ACP methyl ester carboxylesterase